MTKETWLIHFTNRVSIQECVYKKYHTNTDLPNRSFINQKPEDLECQQKSLPLATLCLITYEHGFDHNHDWNEILSALGMQMTANLPTVQIAEEFKLTLKFCGLVCGVVI